MLFSRTGVYLIEYLKNLNDGLGGRPSTGRVLPRKEATSTLWESSRHID